MYLRGHGRRTLRLRRPSLKMRSYVTAPSGSVLFVRLLPQYLRVPVLDGLRQMGGGDTLRPVQIGDGPGHPQDAVVAPGGESHAVEGGLQDTLPGVVQAAELPYPGGGHVGVAADLRPGEALRLQGPGGVDPGLDGGGGLRLLPAAHGLELH